MPMQKGQQGGMPMMQKRQVVMQEHMRKMEAHKATTEDPLRQLVGQQKP